MKKIKKIEQRYEARNSDMKQVSVLDSRSRGPDKMPYFTEPLPLLLGFSRMGLDNPGLVWNLVSDLKL